MNNQQLRILAQIYACQARVEGMRASNQQREAQGDSVMYSEDHFLEEAQALEMLAVEAINS
jgi:hypothetical protein